MQLTVVINSFRRCRHRRVVPDLHQAFFHVRVSTASGAARRWTAGVLCMFGYPEHGASQKSLLLRYRGGAMTPTTVVVVACMCNQVLFHFLNFLPDEPHTDDERDGTRRESEDWNWLLLNRVDPNWQKDRILLFWKQCCIVAMSIGVQSRAECSGTTQLDPLAAGDDFRWARGNRDIWIEVGLAGWIACLKHQPQPVVVAWQVLVCANWKKDNVTLMSAVTGN